MVFFCEFVWKIEKRHANMKRRYVSSYTKLKHRFKNECKVNICNYPVATSHILIVLSRDADNTKSPAGKNATDETLWSWPSIVLKHSNVCVKSHNFIDMSALQETTECK